MIKKRDVLNIIKTAVILFLITGISAFLLGVVNDVTAPIIAKNQEEKQQAAMRTVQPEADNENGFSEMEELPELPDIIEKVFVAKKSGEDFGYVVMAAPNGYNGKISMVIGVDKEGKVCGVDITNQSETPGLGANCTKDEFKAQFIGKVKGIGVVKNNKKDNEIDAITSATITSKAVTEGVNAAIEAVEAIEGGF